MKTYFTLLICAVSLHAFSQPCNCTAAFDYAKQKIETNYSGFADKVTAANRSFYNAFTDSLRNISALPSNQDQQQCVNIIAAWLRFFRDGHVGTAIQAGNTPSVSLNKDSIRNLYANAPKMELSEDWLRNYLQKNKNGLKPLEGIWQNEQGNYKVGVIFRDNKYSGVILRADSVYWIPGQIKFEMIPFRDSMQTRFFMRDHSMQIRQLKMDDVNAGIIEIESVGRWFRLDENGKMVFKGYYPNFGIVQFKKLSDKTNLLTIRSFNEIYRHTIDSIVTANDQLIQNTDNLIIDVRGNGGGSDISYYPLRKYLFTNPYTRYGAKILATNDNIQKFRDLVNNPVFSEAEHEDFRRMVTKMEARLNQFWSSTDAEIFSSDTLQVLPKPKRIGVIIDSICGSTTEQFLLDPVMNSKKSTIYGIHSGGVLDYANVTFFKIPETNIVVQYATSRSNRIDLGKGIDNIGVKPHVVLNSRIPDWVQYVKQDLENKKTP